MSHVYELSTTMDRLAPAPDRLPKLAMLAAITIAWAMTLAWPPPAADLQPRLPSNQAVTPQYPLRVALPEAAPLPTEQLDELIREHEAGSSPRLAEAEIAQPVTVPDLPALDDEVPEQDEQVAAVDLAPGEVLAINYDLVSLQASPEVVDKTTGSLTVEKQLFVDGVSTGEATIRIESGAQILISTTSVARALGDRTEALPRRISSALAKSTGFIPFYELRGAGIDVTYDPITDRVSLSTVS
ncbi:MAG: hypothetical protein ABJ239_09885 [Erythrobacter sp.]